MCYDDISTREAIKRVLSTLQLKSNNNNVKYRDMCIHMCICICIYTHMCVCVYLLKRYKILICLLSLQKKKIPFFKKANNHSNSLVELIS